jgi:serine phosphatase RsbU (regulator of sigma subunit)
LSAAILAQYGGSAQAVLDYIIAATLDFIGDTPQADDFTLVVVKRQE